MDLNWDIIGALIGAIAGAFGMYLKYNWSKSKSEFTIAAYGKDLESTKIRLDIHGSQITDNREKILTLQGDMVTLKDRMIRHEEWIKDENKEIKRTLTENTQALASLDATMKGLEAVMSLVLNKLK